MESSLLFFCLLSCLTFLYWNALLCLVHLLDSYSPSPLSCWESWGTGDRPFPVLHSILCCLLWCQLTHGFTFVCLHTCPHLRLQPPWRERGPILPLYLQYPSPCLAHSRCSVKFCCIHELMLSKSWWMEVVTHSRGLHYLFPLQKGIWEQSLHYSRQSPSSMDFIH